MIHLDGATPPPGYDYVVWLWIHEDKKWRVHSAHGTHKSAWNTVGSLHGSGWYAAMSPNPNRV